MIELLLSMATLLAPDDGSLREALTMAVKQPSQYVAAHPDTAERLGDDPDAAASPALPLLAMAGELIQRHLAVELDGRTDRKEVLWSLEQLSNYSQISPSVRTALKDVQSADALTINWLRAVSAIISKDDWALAALDIRSDTYVVVLLRAPQLAKVRDQATALGWKFDDIREYDPNTWD